MKRAVSFLLFVACAAAAVVSELQSCLLLEVCFLGISFVAFVEAEGAL